MMRTISDGGKRDYVGGGSPSAPMTRLRCLLWLAPALAVLTAGCFKRMAPVRTVDTPQGVAFELAAVADGISEGRTHELLDLSVMRRDCQSDCAMWSVTRHAAGVGSANLKTSRLVYAQAPDGMAAQRPARALVPGRYSVSVTVQQYDSGKELVRSLSLEGQFAIQADGSGVLRVRGASQGGER